MKNIDVKKLELEAVKRMLELGAAEICADLKQSFADLTGKILPKLKNNESSSAPLHL